MLQTFELLWVEEIFYSLSNSVSHTLHLKTSSLPNILILGYLASNLNLESDEF